MYSLAVVNKSLAESDIGSYLFAFNDKLKTDEIYGAANAYDYGMRFYDPRLGRFISIDPLTKKYPELTPYQFASNRPIEGIDIDGQEFGEVIGVAIVAATFLTAATIVTVEMERNAYERRRSTENEGDATYYHPVQPPPIVGTNSRSIPQPGLKAETRTPDMNPPSGGSGNGNGFNPFPTGPLNGLFAGVIVAGAIAHLIHEIDDANQGNSGEIPNANSSPPVNLNASPPSFNSPTPGQSGKGKSSGQGTKPNTSKGTTSVNPNKASNQTKQNEVGKKGDNIKSTNSTKSQIPSTQSAPGLAPEISGMSGTSSSK